MIIKIEFNEKGYNFLNETTFKLNSDMITSNDAMSFELWKESMYNHLKDIECDKVKYIYYVVLKYEEIKIYNFLIAYEYENKIIMNETLKEKYGLYFNEFKLFIRKEKLKLIKDYHFTLSAQ